jgi:hypothetical protein
VYTCNPGTWEAEAGECQVQGHLWLHIQNLSQKRKKILNLGTAHIKILITPLHWNARREREGGRKEKEDRGGRKGKRKWRREEGREKREENRRGEGTQERGGKKRRDNEHPKYLGGMMSEDNLSMP